MNNAASILDEFVVIAPDKGTTIERCDQRLYARLDANYNGFAGHELVSCHRFDSDWTSWEMHPAGDEIVLLLAGRVSFVLNRAEGEQVVDLVNQGQYVIVPRGVWHTARVSEPSTVLFITPGEGTQHRSG